MFSRVRYNRTQHHKCQPGTEQCPTKLPGHRDEAKSGCHSQRRARGAEELGGRAHRGRVPPVRHDRRAIAAEQDLAVAIVDDELLDIESPDSPGRFT